jgi:hypothetical protein
MSDVTVVSSMVHMVQTSGQSDAFLSEVRLHVYARAAETGRIPQPPEIAAALGRPQAEVERALRQLASDEVLILAPTTATFGPRIPSAPFHPLSESKLGG